MKTIQKVSFAIAFGWTGTALAEEIVWTSFDYQDLDKVCVEVPGAGYQLDLDKLVCSGYGQACADGAAPQVFYKAFAKKWEYAFSDIAAGNDPVLRLTQGSTCTASSSPTDHLNGVCGPIQCIGYTGPRAEGSAPRGPIVGAFRLREKAEDILVTDKKKAGRARLSFKDDLSGETDIFEFKGAAGFVAQTFLLNDADDQKLDELSVAPFIALERINFESKPDITNLSFGGTAALTIRSFAGETGFSHGFTATAAVLSDEEAKSAALTGSLAYRPHIAGFGHVFSTGAQFGQLGLHLTPSLRTDFGHVLEDSETKPLPEHSEYLRAGGGLKAILFGNDMSADDAAINGASLSLEYQIQPFITGPEGSFERFEAKLGYVFQSAPNFGLELSYVNGDVDPTLQNVEFVRAGFTAQF